MSDRPVEVVTTASQLEEMISALEGVERLGVDTESNSFFAYREKVCLLQLSDLERDWVVDPLQVDPRPLAPIFADPEREIILHAAEHDVGGLWRDFGFEIGRLFDTQAAGMVMGLGQQSLQRMVEEKLGVHLPKEQQRSDWGRRPLSDSQLAYAVNDTRYLIPLREQLVAQLYDEGRWAPALAVFRRLRESRPLEREVDLEAYFNIRGYDRLEPPGRAVIARLFALREARAEALNRPPFRILGNDGLLSIAQQLPRDPAGLKRLRGVSPRLPDRFVAQLLKAVEDGVKDPSPPPARRAKKRKSPSPDELELERRFERLRRWRNKVAEREGLVSRTIASNRVLKAIAKAQPSTQQALVEVEGVDAFLTGRYGADILSMLSADEGSGE